MKQLEQSLHAQGEEKQKIEKKIEAIRGEANRLREKRAHIDGIGKKLASKKSLLKSLEQQNVNLVVEARARLEKTSELAKKKSKCFVSYLEAARSQTLLNKDRITLIYQEAQLENELSKIENEAREYQQRKSEVEASIEAATFAVREARDEAKYALDEASNVNGVPLDRGVPDSHKVPHNFHFIKNFIKNYFMYYFILARVRETSRDFRGHRSRDSSSRGDFSMRRRRRRSSGRRIQTTPGNHRTDEEAVREDGK
jgi:hypothetical protein